jgi:hypothetical protein
MRKKRRMINNEEAAPLRMPGWSGAEPRTVVKVRRLGVGFEDGEMEGYTDEWEIV